MEQRIGVFVCDCGTNIAQTIDTKKVAQAAEPLPCVAGVYRNRYTCAEPGQQEIQDAIERDALDSVVVAACTPKIHEPTFRRCVADVGMNPYRMEMANIREHCSWVHSSDAEGATTKAIDLVASAVSRARLLKPQNEARFQVTDAALVIGGGVAGIQAALDLADAGHQVYLVEKEPSIGGIMAALDKTYPTMDCSI